MKRILINSFRNIRRSPYQALAAIMVLTVTFFVAVVFMVLMVGSHTVLTYFETRPQVTAFFNDTVSEEALLNLKAELEKQETVAGVRYISKPEALLIYQEQNQDDPLLLEMVTADILPASLEVSAKAVEHLPGIKVTLEQSAGVEEVVFQQDVIDALTKWTRGIRIAGVVLVSVLIFTSVLVMTIIISLKVSSKRQEISTLRLLGASRWFIHGPFIIEGAWYGMIGALLAWGSVYLLILYATPILLDFFGDIPVLPVPLATMLLILLSTGGSAVVLGVLAGSFSSRRFGS